MMLMLIWKNISRRRAQSVLTVTITMLTVMVFVMVLGVIQTMNRGLALSRERLGADAVLIPKYARMNDTDLLFTAIPENVYMPAGTFEQARELQGVAAMTPQFFTQTLAMSCCDANEEGRVIGYDAETDFILSPYLPEEYRDGLEGRQMVMGADKGDGLVGYSYMILSRRFDVVAALEPTGTGMDGTMFLDMDQVRDLCLSNPILSMDWRDRDPYSLISAIMIRFEEGVDPAAFVRQVEESGMEARCIITGDTIAALQSQLSLTTKIMIALWLASLLIAALTLFGRFNSLARDRKKEIGLLRAMGLRKDQVFFLIIGETCAMAMMGGILGSAAGLYTMEPVIAALQDAFRLSASVWTSTLAASCGAAGLALAVSLGFLAAVSPAVRSASMDPQAAITQGNIN